MSSALSRNVRDSKSGPRSLRELVTHEVPFDKLFDLTVWVVLALVAFYNLSSLNPDKTKVGLDKFVAIKLLLTGLSGMIGFYGLLAIPRVIHLLTTAPGIWFVSIASCYTIASIFGITPMISLASSISLWCILLLTATAVASQGPLAVVKAALFGIAAFIITSWVAYFAFPSLGVFAEPITEGRFKIRMSGIAHPNVLGQYAACGFGLILVLWQHKELKSKLWFGVAILCLAALIASVSRTSTAALILTIAYVYRDSIFRFFGPIIILGIVVFMAGGLLVASSQFTLNESLADQILAPLSKSGDTEELTSMTGRTDIWAYAVQRLYERPLTGFGPATSKTILKDYSSYTHNLWLNVAFCGGVFAFIAMLFLTIGRVADSWFRPDRIIDFIIIFILLNGVAENVIFSFIPSVPTMLLFTASIWRANEAISKREAQ